MSRLIFNSHAVGMDSWFQAGIKSILLETLFVLKKNSLAKNNFILDGRFL